MSNVIDFPNAAPLQEPCEAEPLIIRVRVEAPPAPSGSGIASALIWGVLSFVVVSALLGGLL